MSRARQAASTILASAVALLLLACAGTSNDGPKFNTATGQHPSNWVQVHWQSFIPDQSQCQSCHGSTSDPASSGGISGVSCFSCHTHPPSHQSGWELGSNHGRMGAQLAAADTSGFAYCAKCHGSNYDNPIGTAPSCRSCHTRAPHPDRPWLSTSLDQPSHTFTDASNAPECFKCHADGANSTLVPTNPAPAGTSPGCFNNTMCHGTTIPSAPDKDISAMNRRPAPYQASNPPVDPNPSTTQKRRM